MKNKKGLLSAFVLMLMILTTVMSTSVWAALPTATKQKNNSSYVYVKKEGKKAYLYYTATNTKVTGFVGRTELPKGSGNWYYFKAKTGRVYCNSSIKKKGKMYYCAPNGLLWKGWRKTSKRITYFGPKTNARQEGWTAASGKWYYLKPGTGELVTGWITVNDKKYYSDPSTGVRTTGWKKISNKWYHFNKKGVMQKGLVKVGDDTYYLYKGVRKTGLRKINGKKYYFDTSTGKMYNGFKTVKSKTYYFSQSGPAVTGWLTLNGKSYFFNNAGVMQKGWMTSGNRKYYLDPSTGAVTTGKATIGGKTYDFGTQGYISTEPEGSYSLQVNLSTCVVTAFKGSTPVRAMLCSPGKNGATPTGNYSLKVKRHWHELFGGVWGQYTTQITGNYLFHSVYYYNYRDIYSLSATEFVKLGSPASAGCVRLSCADAYYIYNLPTGTPVKIFWGSTSDDPLPRPSNVSVAYSNGKPYDPTDPNPYD